MSTENAVQAPRAAPVADQTVVLSRPVKARLTALQSHLRTSRGRVVTYDQTVEWLLDIYAEDEASQ